MKKMLLMSSGYEAILNLVPKDKHIGFIPTAEDFNNRDFKQSRAYLFLKDHEYNIVDIDIKNLNKKEFIKLINKIDTLYVAGGSTFYLLRALQDKNFQQEIVRRVNEGMFYVGESAGAMILSNDIAYGLPLDKADNCPDVDLKSTEGLGFLDISVIPHYDMDDIAYQKAIQEILTQEENVLSINEEIAILIEEKNGKINIVPVESKFCR